MGNEAELRSDLKAVRTRLGLSQSELARAAGVTRQTIGGIEASLYAPSAAVALKLARALGCRVEELFWLEDEAAPLIEAHPAPDGLPVGTTGGRVGTTGGRVRLGRVGGRWIAHGLEGENAWRSELVPADGLIEENGNGTNPGDTTPVGGTIPVRLLDSPEALERTAFIAGCAPALSLWTRSAERWHPGLRAAWLHANSTQSLELLVRGEVHIAGVHLSNPGTGEDNLPFVQEIAGQGTSQNLVLINFGIWDEGFIVASGNPHGLNGAADLARPGITLVNRERGAGARLLLDTLLTESGVPAAQVRGYDTIATSHQAVARMVRDSGADAGVGARAVADAYGLGFVPLRRVCYDLALRADTLDFEPVRDVLEALNHRRVRAQLRLLGGYDTSRTGEIVARVSCRDERGMQKS